MPPKRRLPKTKAVGRTNVHKSTGAAMRPVPRVRISPCLRNYIVAVTDTRSAYKDSESYCVPDQQIIRTHRVKARATGTFVTNSNQVGFIAYSPQVPDLTTGCHVFTTTSSYTGSTTSAIDTTASGVATTPSSNLSGLVANSATQQWRVVGSTLYVKYIGTTLNQGGSVDIGKTPSNQNVNAATLGTFQDVFPQTIARKTVRRGELKAHWHPATDEELSLVPPVTGTPPAPCIAAVVTAPTTTPATFAWEVYTLYEVIGTGVGALDRAEADNAFPAMMAAMERADDTGDFGKLMNYFAEELLVNSSYVVTDILPAAGKIASGAVGLYQAYQTFRNPAGR